MGYRNWWFISNTKFGFLDISQGDHCSELHAEFLDVDNPQYRKSPTYNYLFSGHSKLEWC